MRNVYALSATVIALTCCTISSVESKEDSFYIKMPVRVQNRIEEHSFRRTNVQQDAVNFIGLCVDNDDVNVRVIDLFRELSAENYCKYFASDEFYEFAKYKLGSIPRIVYAADSTTYLPEYWARHKFQPESLVIYPEPGAYMLGFKDVDANGIARWERSSSISIQLSLVTFEANQKRERHQNKIASINTNGIAISPHSITPTAAAPRVSKVDSIDIKMPVRILDKIEEQGFHRTNFQEDAVKFIGLCVDNDDVNSKVLKQFSELSATNYCKYFSGEEFFEFAKTKLGSFPRLVCPPLDLSFRDEARYWSSHNFPPNSIVIFPDSRALALDLKFVDANGMTQPEPLVNGIQQVHRVSIKLSLAWRFHQKKYAQHQNEVASIAPLDHNAIVTSTHPITTTSMLAAPKAARAPSTGSSSEAGGTVSLAGPKLESPKFDSYMADLRRRMIRAWFPPRGQGRVVVQFKINKDGTLSSMSELRIERSSGDALADKTVLIAVQNAAPFNALPDDFPNPYEISIAFDYNDFR